MGAGFRYFLREVSQSLKRNLMLNFSSISTVMVLIFQLGVFILLFFNLNNLTAEAKGKLQLTAVLTDNLSLERAGQLKQRVMKHPDVEMVRYVSKEMAFDRLRNRLEGRVDISTLEENPLPDTLVVEMKDPSKINDIAQEIKKYPGIEDVRFGDAQVVDMIIRLSRRVYTVGAVILVMLLVSAVFLIANTIRLTVFSRRREIAIMELVGATQWFIRGPFIVEGLLHGVFGAGIAILLVNALYEAGAGWVTANMSFIPVIPPGQVLFQLSLGLLGAGMLVGGLASYFSVNRYLKV